MFVPQLLENTRWDLTRPYCCDLINYSQANFRRKRGHLNNQFLLGQYFFIPAISCLSRLTDWALLTCVRRLGLVFKFGFKSRVRGSVPVILISLIISTYAKLHNDRVGRYRILVILIAICTGPGVLVNTQLSSSHINTYAKLDNDAENKSEWDDIVYWSFWLPFVYETWLRKCLNIYASIPTKPDRLPPGKDNSERHECSLQTILE
jgi:hypothetical protein